MIMRMTNRPDFVSSSELGLGCRVETRVSTSFRRRSAASSTDEAQSCRARCIIWRVHEEAMASATLPHSHRIGYCWVKKKTLTTAVGMPIPQYPTS